jgi:hypothetical protein
MSKKQRKGGEVPPGRLGVFDAAGNLRGHVGPHATSVTAARFTNKHGAKLGTKDGRKAWLTPNEKYNAKIAAATKPGARATPGQLVGSGVKLS